MERDEQLRDAVVKGDLPRVQRLLDAGAEGTQLDEHGYGLLFWAAKLRLQNPESMIRLLHGSGAQLDLTSIYGESALRSSAYRPPFLATHVLLELGADERQLEWTPLHHAVAASDAPAVQTQLEAGADLAALDWWNRTPWLLALEVGNLNIAQVLAAAGSDTEAPGHCKTTPLMYALHGDHVEVFTWLLALGADPIETNEFDQKIGTIAVEEGAATCLPLLLQRGWVELSDITESADDRTTALLLKAGADIDTLSGEGDSLLMCAAESGDTDSVRFLLAHGASPNANSTGEASLHKAIAFGFVEIGRALIDAGADANQLDVDGWSPFAFATSREAVGLLLSAGADPQLETYYGSSQLKLLAERSGEELAKYARWRATQDPP